MVVSAESADRLVNTKREGIENVLETVGDILEITMETEFVQNFERIEEALEKDEDLIDLMDSGLEFTEEVMKVISNMFRVFLLLSHVFV